LGVSRVGLKFSPIRNSPFTQHLFLRVSRPVCGTTLALVISPSTKNENDGVWPSPISIHCVEPLLLVLEVMPWD
jgi:hypothetical protein